MPLFKIISGGQTGVDRGALDAAMLAKFPSGGWCPKGRRTEDGYIADRYPLRETTRGTYRQRTLRNVLDSDGTLILYFGELGGGTALTLAFCIRHSKPYALIHANVTSITQSEELVQNFVMSSGIRVLNIAGPRTSEEPLAYHYAFKVITRFLQNYRMASCPK